MADRAIISLASGGIAQLGERLNGIQEVSGSIPLISTIESPETVRVSGLFVFWVGTKKAALSNTFPALTAGEVCDEGVRHALLASHIQMPVNIGSDLDVGVAEPFLHIFQRESHVQQVAGVAVAKLIETNMRAEHRRIRS